MFQFFSVRHILVAGTIALLGCGSTVTAVQRTTPLRGSARWVMLPFPNYSEAPQAGERVEEMLETVLRQAGVESLDHYPAPSQDEAHLVMSDRQRYEESQAWAKTQAFDYGVTGSVEEWRYKSGLDGDPAVGLSVRVLDLKNDRVLWSASGTKTGGGGENTSGTALRLLSGLLREMSFTR
jgi:hypothetical protein